MTKHVLSIFCFILVTSPLFADERSKAAEDLMIAMDMKGTMSGMAIQAANIAIQADPRLGSFRAVLEKFYSEVFTSKDFFQEMRTIYENAYTTQELKDLIVFYKTPTGARSLKIMPQLFQQGANVGR